MYLIFLGAPGCGKGTQAQLLKESQNIVHLSTGEMLRSEIEAKTPLGLQLEKIMASGNYVSDNIILLAVEKKLASLGQKGILLDGFPRTLIQAQALDQLLVDQCLPGISAVIYFKINDDVLVNRIAGRFNCADCGHVYHDVNKPTKVAGVCDVCGSHSFARRVDDTEEKLKKRLEVYYQNTYPLISYYKEKGVLFEVDSTSSVDVIQSEILSILSSV